MKSQDFSTTYLVDESPKEIFDQILDVRKWWSGLFAETIEGSTAKLDDQFSFRAGEGAHYSKQKLVELVPYKKIVWLVTDSALTFIDKEDEWTGTKICFDIAAKGNQTEVRFTHEGLVPAIECYNSCSNAWGEYLDKFLTPLKIENGKNGRNLVRHR